MDTGQAPVILELRNTPRTKRTCSLLEAPFKAKAFVLVDLEIATVIGSGRNIKMSCAFIRDTLQYCCSAMLRSEIVAFSAMVLVSASWDGEKH